MPKPKAAGGTTARPQDWRTVEALGHAYFLQKGFRVLFSLYDQSVYDFVVQDKEGFRTVNVKKATRMRDGPNRFCIANTQHARQNDMARPDVLLVWFKDFNQFIELPGEFLKGRNTRHIPAALVQQLKDHPNGKPAVHPQP